MREIGRPEVTATDVDHQVWVVERSRATGEFDELEASISAFAERRDWDQFHTPRNLLLALVGEVGELAELLQRKSGSEVEAFLSTELGKQRFSEELADVFIYLVRLAQKGGVDLIQAVTSKLEMNEQKYPVEKSFGSAAKYDEL